MDISVRPLRHDEGAVLGVVFAGLSPRSRYLRFHSPVGDLGPPLRRALLAVDGWDHVALVAVSGRGEPVGIARLIRDRLRPDQAEVAFEVVDAWHRRGVGRLLLTALEHRRLRPPALGVPGVPRPARAGRDGAGLPPVRRLGDHDGRHPRRPGRLMSRTPLPDRVALTAVRDTLPVAASIAPLALVIGATGAPARLGCLA